MKHLLVITYKDNYSNYFYSTNVLRSLVFLSDHTSMNECGREMMALMMMRRSANIMGVTTTARAMMMSDWNGMQVAL